MLTGTIRNQIDKVWETFWSNGITNPLSVIEQMSYLLFMRRLDEMQILEEKKANRLGQPIQRIIFPEEKQDCRWNRFKDLDPETMYETVRDKAFKFIKEGLQSGSGQSNYAKFMKDAIFMIPTAATLASVVDQIDKIPMDDRDTKGDVYEYMLGKLTTAGVNGQFRTPRHIIKLMVDLMAPTPQDTICDPAAGTAGFLVAAVEYLRDHHSDTIFTEHKEHFETGMFHGYDFDNSMLRIASMNMMLHGLENPDIRYRDSLSENAAMIKEDFTLVLANPPFKGSINESEIAKNLLAEVKTKKTELLFLALFLRILKKGGRAAVIVPDGLLFGGSKAHKDLRETLVEKHKLDGVMSMPSGVFKPYAGVSTAILLFTKTGAGGTDNVWFYDMQADGFSLDDKRTKLSDAHEQNNLADILARWQNLDAEAERKRTEQSFFVSKAEIVENGFDLSLNRYKEIVYEAVTYDPPEVILGKINDLEVEIQTGLKDLGKALKDSSV